jgi:hypothetical protein
VLRCAGPDRVPTCADPRPCRFGLNVVVSDIDVMWVRNPLPFFKK